MFADFLFLILFIPWWCLWDMPCEEFRGTINRLCCKLCFPNTRSGFSSVRAGQRLGFVSVHGGWVTHSDISLTVFSLSLHKHTRTERESRYAPFDSHCGTVIYRSVISLTDILNAASPEVLAVIGKLSCALVARCPWPGACPFELSDF